MNLSPESESLFSTARDDLSPSEADRERNFVALSKKIAAGGLAVTAGITAAHAGATTSKALATSGLALKIALPLAITGIVATSAAIFVRTSSPSTPASTPNGHAVPSNVGASTAPARGAQKAQANAPGTPSQGATDVTAPSSELDPATNDTTTILELPETPPGSTEGSSGASGTNGAATTDTHRGASERTNGSSARTTTEARGGDGTSSSLSKTTIATKGATQNKSTPAQNKDAVPEKPATTQPSSELREEVLLLERIYAAQRMGDLSEVHALVAEHKRTFPDGKLREECMASDVIAYCATDDATAARARAASFQKSFPRSPLLARVRTACEK